MSQLHPQPPRGVRSRGDSLSTSEVPGTGADTGHMILDKTGLFPAVTELILISCCYETGGRLYKRSGKILPCVSDSLGLGGLQDARLPCPSPSPGACSNSSPSGDPQNNFPTFLKRGNPFDYRRRENLIRKKLHRLEFPPLNGRWRAVLRWNILDSQIFRAHGRQGEGSVLPGRGWKSAPGVRGLSALHMPLV